MTRLRKRLLVAGVVAVCGVAGLAQAGPYSDDLAKCLVRSATAEEKNNLIRWVFAVASLHPAVRSASALTDAERADLSKSAGTLLTVLLTDRCRPQADEAVRYEGEVTIAQSFSVLSQAAMRELLTHSDVQAGFTEFGKYLDQDKIKALGKAPTGGDKEPK